MANNDINKENLAKISDEKAAGWVKSETADRKLTREMIGLFHTSKKTIQDFTSEIERRNRFQSCFRYYPDGTILDDRGKLMDIYDACVQTDSHLKSTLETLYSKILGERFALGREDKDGKFVPDFEATKKIRNIQFWKVIIGIVESKLYGFSGFELSDDVDPVTGMFKEINMIPRRNILPDQRRMIKRQGQWNPGWSFDDPKYSSHYILVNTGDLGLYSAAAPDILAKRFTNANYINFGHTYGQPIIHGKIESENSQDRQRMAQDIANAATEKVIVTGLNDTVDVKTCVTSNSERVFTGLISSVDKNISNLILGSEAVAGAQQSYVGASRIHSDVYADRIHMYRNYIELVFNEEFVPRLVKMKYIPAGLTFKYPKENEMSDENRIRLFDMLSSNFEVDADAVEAEFGIRVGKQLNQVMGAGVGGEEGDFGGDGYKDGATRHLTDEQYLRRYGHPRPSANFLRERR